MKKQQGFTLIELVVVIIILGILAVTAAPKFINLQSDARASALQGLKGAIQGANALVFSKAALAGKEGVGSADAGTTASVDIGTGTNANLNYGSIQSTAAELANAVELSISETTTASTDWFLVKGSNGASKAVLYQAGSPYASDDTKECYLEYTPKTSTTAVPVLTVLADDC